MLGTNVAVYLQNKRYKNIEPINRIEAIFFKQSYPKITNREDLIFVPTTQFAPLHLPLYIRLYYIIIIFIRTFTLLNHVSCV